MPCELLKCIICPKATQKFSDVSHLLTHVGSKGHLAQLHRLQVKSHQDVDAGRILTIYNQWFQEHGIASLLSERMQQKEQKKAATKVTNQALKNAVTKRDKPPGRKPQQPTSVSAYDMQPSLLDDQESVGDFGSLDYIPVKPRRSQYPTLNSSPLKMLPSRSVQDEDEDNADGPKVKPAPGTPQLKGIQYPGMDLFDAAPEEMKRRRNQKKDASVLRYLERNAALVIPTETVHSAAGVVLKRRHMDEMETDSPVPGEEHIVQPSPKRRRSTGLRAKRQPKKIKQEQTKRRPGRPRKQLETPSKLPSSSIADMIRSTSRFSPTEDENLEFKLTVRNMGKRKKRQAFTVYQSSSPLRNVDGSSETVPPAYAEASAVRPQLSYALPLWSRQQTDNYDPFKLIRDRFAGDSAFADIGQGKENAAVNAFGMNISPQGQATINPLFFQTGTVNAATSISSQNRLNTDIAVNIDPFVTNSVPMPVRNPLMAAFDRMHKDTMQDQDFGFDSSDAVKFSAHYRQPLFAP